ncbi:hypothetical protein TNCV_2483761 [Trichonephila clavipes]|uniref:Uncharacterized protein n=1 Tax=Trichonephila clavipes TaxID=2585209 RepID=A0A8X6VZD3_TRICX|nr:hypothetical protein TNCV_2483761 [Trichonephila clavipes]
MASLGDQFLPPANIGRVDEEMIPPELAIPGSPRIKENEGELRTKEFRISNHTVEIEPASSPKLGEELPKANCEPLGISNV